VFTRAAEKEVCMVRICFALTMVLALDLSMVAVAADHNVEELQKRQSDDIAELTEIYSKAVEAEANAEANIDYPYPDKCVRYYCSAEERLKALQQSQLAFMTYRNLDCRIEPRLTYWAGLREPMPEPITCISNRTRARIRHLRDHYQLQSDPKPLSEREQNRSETSWVEFRKSLTAAEKAFTAAEKALTESYVKVQETQFSMDPGDDCSHDSTCAVGGRCEALRASQFAFMAYRFSHCQVVVPLGQQFVWFGRNIDLATLQCMEALTRERIEILRDYQVHASKAPVVGRGPTPVDFGCVTSNDIVFRAPESSGRPRGRSRSKR